MDWLATRLLAWFDQHGRRDLPWQQDINPYRVWISEIMLQQTQVTTVIPYFQRFMDRFPTVSALAQADIDEVLHLWTGLGYYARGRNLYKAAGRVVTEFGGELPNTVAELEDLPGIGRSTAGAIAAIACDVRAPILDGNVKRVLTRFHAVGGYPGASAVSKSLWALADDHTPTTRFADYTQAVMDLGATVCARSSPTCTECPLNTGCEAYRTSRVADFPGRNPRKEKPVREARLFVLHDASGGCLLERRPPDGIWGGLWTPPEQPISTSAEEFLEQVGLQPNQRIRTHTRDRFRHTFTHFHLDIEPVFIELTSPPSVVRDRDDLRWYLPGSNEPLGLSAPAVKLLASLSESVLE